MKFVARWQIAGDQAAGVAFRFLLFVAVLFLVVPIVVSAVLSFDDREFIGRFPPTSFSLRWYRSFLQNPSYVDGLFVSLKLALLSTLVSALAGAGTAFVLAEARWRGRAFVETLFLSPRFVPTVVIGFAMLGFASSLHIFDAFTRLVMGHIVITIPFTVRATLAGLVGIRRNLTEAAISLGASPWRAFLDITMPLARTGIIAGVLMAFALSFDEVAVSIFLTDAFTQTLPVALVAEMRANLNLTVAAVSTIFATIAVLIVLFLDRAVGLDNIIGKGMYRG
jgi:putative spermidine/putrescine transport system permease protein